MGILGAGAGGLAAGGLVGYAAGRSVNSKKKRARAKTSSRKIRRNNSKQKRPYTAGKRKDTSTRRIRYTKNNQPYIILKSGKARFISKKSVRLSRKRKGGRY